MGGSGFQVRGEDEDRRFHHLVRSRGPDNRSSEVDVRGSEAPAVPCLRALIARQGF